MNDFNMERELTAVRRENQQLRQQVEQVKKELTEWQHNAILLTPEEIYAFYMEYRMEKRKEREEADRIAMQEIEKLMALAGQRKGENHAKNV